MSSSPVRSSSGNQSTGPEDGRSDTAAIAHPHGLVLLLTVSAAMMGGVRDKMSQRSDGLSPSQPRPCQHVSNMTFPYSNFAPTSSSFLCFCLSPPAEVFTLKKKQ
ncbi:hypothetical protein JOQ06_015007, partial [Pogonophryne albipinna]